MDPGYIFKSVEVGVKWLAIGGGIYFGTCVCCQIYDGWPFQKKIKSQGELELVVEEESKKLGLDPT